MRVTTAGDLGNLVHDRRGALGWTQADLAERAGASRLWVSQVESGHPGASLTKVLRLLASLGLAMDVDVPEPKPRSPRLDHLRALRQQSQRD